MDRYIFIGLVMHLIHFHLVYGYILWYGNPINLPYGQGEHFGSPINPVRLMVSSQPNTADNIPNNVYGNNRMQSIFNIPDSLKYFKTLTNAQNYKNDNLNNGQYFPRGYEWSNYNNIPAQYASPNYEIIYPQSSNYQKDSSIPPNFYLFPGVSNVESNPQFNNQNLYSNQKSITLPNSEISTSDDELYKVSLKSHPFTINQQNPNENNSDPGKVFKTNFCGDLSKCDMICKCRYLYMTNDTSEASSLNKNHSDNQPKSGQVANN